MITHIGRRLFLGVSHAPTQGAGPHRCPILEVPFYLCVHLLLQNYQHDVVTHEEGLDFKGSATSPSQRDGSPALPFLGFSIYAYIHPLTQNDQVPHGNTRGGACSCEVSHAISFAQMRRAFCQQQLSFLFGAVIKDQYRAGFPRLSVQKKTNLLTYVRTFCGKSYLVTSNSYEQNVDNQFYGLKLHQRRCIGTDGSSLGPMLCMKIDLG